MTDDAKSSQITHTEKSSVQIFTMVLVLLFTMVLPKIVMLSKMISVFVLSVQVLSNLTEVLPLLLIMVLSKMVMIIRMISGAGFDYGFAAVVHHGVAQGQDGNAK